MKKAISLVVPRSSFLINDSVFPPLGVMYLSAALEFYGIDVQVLDLGLDGSYENRVIHDIVGISFTTPQSPEAYRLLDYYKKQGKTVIAGGPHPTHMKEECLEKGFDHVIQGYGEKALLEYFGVTVGYIPQIPNREALPLLSYPYTINGYPATTVMTARGCPYDCSFCARIDKNYKQTPTNVVISDIYLCHDLYGYEAFMIFDDTFVASRKRVEKFANEFSGSGFIFRCFARSNLINDEVCKLLKRMGIVEIGVGVESGSDKVLDNVSKGTTRRANLKAFQILKEHGIRGKAFIIVGLPGETHDTIKETMSWIKQADPYDIDAGILQPMPGSNLFKYPEKYGIKFEYDPKNMWYKGTPTKYVSVSRTKGLSHEELIHYRDELERKFKRKELLK